MVVVVQRVDFAGQVDVVGQVDIVGKVDVVGRVHVVEVLMLQKGLMLWEALFLLAAKIFLAMLPQLGNSQCCFSFGLLAVCIVAGRLHTFNLCVCLTCM
jgi:hypothetical protein